MNIDTETVTITSAGKPDVIRTVSALRGMVAKLRGEDTADLFVLNLYRSGAANFSIRGVHCTAYLDSTNKAAPDFIEREGGTILA